MQGIIVHVRGGRGFCFIKPDSPTEPEIFCHATAFEGQDGFSDASEGDRVEFELVPSRTKPGKMQADPVRVLN
jgi:cold shock CspA family protein